MYRISIILIVTTLMAQARPYTIPESRLSGTMNANGQTITNAADVVLASGESLAAAVQTSNTTDTALYVADGKFLVEVDAVNDSNSGYVEILAVDSAFNLDSVSYRFSTDGMTVTPAGGAQPQWDFQGWLKGVDDPIDDAHVGDRGYNNSIYVRPQVASDFLTLDREIASWEDIGITFSNALVLNDPVIVTNDSAWTGWTTTGTLSDGNISLLNGEYLLSPVLADGLADLTIEQNGDGRINWAKEVVTNGVSVGQPPYYGGDGQLKISGGIPMPFMSPGITVSNVFLTSYGDRTEAALTKYISSARRIEVETDPSDLTRKVYVDESLATGKTYTDSELADYAADPDKTLLGAELRLGNMWVVSAADTSGDRFIVSGGEISGDGELVGTTNDFIISKNDYPLLSFTSAASGLFITNHTLTVVSSDIEVTLNIATNGVTAEPFVEWTEDIVVGEWTRVGSYFTESYPSQSGGAYTLEFLLPLTDTMYFRAMQPVGDSVAAVETDVWDFGSAEIKMTDVSNNVWVVTMSTNGTLTIIAE